MNLKDKVVIITGGSKGFGKTLAELFVKEGLKVIISSNNDVEIQNIAKEIGAFGFYADVTKEEELTSLLNETIKKFGRVDIWINNAGIWLPHKPIEETDWKRAHDLIEVNLFGTVYGSKVALIQMRKQGFGLIINILSTSALDGKVNETAYCASKFAAMGFTKSLKKEVDGKDIKIMAIYPGGMQTNLFDEKKPENYGEFMSSNYVAEKVINNLKLENPEEELVIQRP
ncbi:MAG: SDR family oxidoreductase [Candidatus Paceibacterota bacterium]